MSTRRLSAVHIFVVLVFTTPSTLFGQSPEHIPQGWYVYPNSKLNHADVTTLKCFNYSRNEWAVSDESDGVRITKWTGRKAEVPSLPPLLKVQPGMPGPTPSAGLIGAMRFEKGWLLAYDAVGSGGGMWLTNQDGSKAKRVVSENVRGIIPLNSDSVLVLSGWVEMIPDYGKEYVFSNPDGLNIKLKYSARLDGAPMASTKLPDGSVLFVTTRSLHAITKSESESEKKPNYRFPSWVTAQYPNSIVARTDGTIFIGMRMFVLQLTPNPSGYSEDWLLPNSCSSFELDEKVLACVCKSW
jgi:hypothetical protein